MKHPLKNEADLLIFYTAMKENMYYLVTGNTDDFKKLLELFKRERDTKYRLYITQTSKSCFEDSRF